MRLTADTRLAKPACWVLAAALLIVILGPATAPGQTPVDCAPGTPVTSASGDLSITIHHPPDRAPEAQARQCTPTEHAVLRGPWTIKASAKSSFSYLKAFSISIVPTDSSIPVPREATKVGGPYYDPPAALTQPPGQPPQDPNAQVRSEDTITFPWDTTSLTKHNGVYQIKISAQSATDSVEAFVFDLKVDNPPAKPTEVNVVPDGPVAVVSWKRNPEPDVTGYRVLRSVEGEPATRLDTVSGVELRDDTAPQGVALRYQVVAVRKSVVSKEKTILSAASDATPALTIGSAVGPALSSGRQALLGSRRGGSSGFDFAPALPYETAPPVPAPGTEGEDESASDEMPQEVTDAAQGAEDTRPTSTFDKMRYFGTSMLLLAIGVLVAKFARRVLSAS